MAEAVEFELSADTSKLIADWKKAITEVERLSGKMVQGVDGDFEKIEKEAKKAEKKAAKLDEKADEDKALEKEEKKAAK